VAVELSANTGEAITSQAAGPPTSSDRP
jgi:hypothetical protein